jgi:hypothetical protein
MSQALCPNCEKMTPVGNSPKLGENVICKFCGVESVIVWLNPIELDLPYDDNFEDEDYVYEDDGYFDDEDDGYEDYP